jgi:hypothetical protein
LRPRAHLLIQACSASHPCKRNIEADDLAS